MKKMTTFLGGALIAAALLLSGCDNFLNANADAREKLQSEINYAKAESVSFTIAPVSSEDGQVTSKATSAKIGFPVAIEFEVNQKVGSFVRWDVYSNYKGDGSDVALTDAVKFEKEDARKTEMTILSVVPNMRIIPRVSANPKVRLVSAKNDLLQSMGSVTPSGTQAWNPDNTHDVSAESENGYAIKGWKVYRKSADDTEIPVTSVKATDGDGNDLTKKYFGFDAPENPSIEFLSINVSETQKKSSATIKFNGSDIEGLYFEPVYAERPIINPLFVTENNQVVTMDHVFEFELSDDINYENFVQAKAKNLIQVIGGDQPKNFKLTYPGTGKFGIAFIDSISPGAQVKIIISGMVANSQGITIGESHSYSFRMSSQSDSKAPEITSCSLYYNTGTSYNTILGKAPENFNKNTSFSAADQGKRVFTNGSYATQFKIYMSSKDNIKVSKYEITERVKYLPGNMVVPKQTAPNPDYQLTPSDYTIIQDDGVILFDDDDNWTGQFSSENIFKKKWEVVASGETTDNTPYFFDAKIQIGGVHEFSVVAIDSSGNRSEAKKAYIEFKPSPLVLSKHTNRNFSQKYSWDAASNQVNIEIKSDSEYLDSKLYNEIRLAAESAFYEYRDSGYFILEKWNTNSRLMNINEYVHMVSSGSVSSGTTTMYGFSRLSTKANRSIKGTGITYKYAIVDKYGIPYNPMSSNKGYAMHTATGCSFYGVTVGDIIYYNPATDYLFTVEAEDVLKYDGNSKPIAAIVGTKDGQINGMALESATLFWTDKNKIAYFSEHKFENKKGDKEAWESLVEQEKALGKTTYKDPATYYPAFNHCNTYGTAVLGFDSSNGRTNAKKLATGWYMPPYKDHFTSAIKNNYRLQYSYKALNSKGIFPDPITYTVAPINSDGMTYSLCGGYKWKYTPWEVVPFYDFTSMLNK